MSPHLADLPEPSATGFRGRCYPLAGAELEYILHVTNSLSEAVLCAKLMGKKPADQHINKLVVIATELRKIGVHYPRSLKYALDIPPQTSSSELSKLKRYGDLMGYVETATSEYVKGWALNEGLKGKPAELEIIVNRVSVAVVIADMFRKDLAEAGIGSGNHAFMYRFHPPISLIRDKKIVVRRLADRAVLQTIFQ